VEIQGQSVPSDFRITHPGEIRFDIPRHLYRAASEETGTVLAGGLRARLKNLADRAQKVQLAACRISRALDALGRIEQSLSFALEAAHEARQARTLPAGALEALQSQVDLSIGGADWEATGASFGGNRLFSGAVRIECGGQDVQLPALSAASIGGNWVTSMAAVRVETGEIEYSQSVASVFSGGPNCLEQCAEGAVMALSAGLDHVRGLAARLQRFHETAILPAAGELAVALANAVASETAPGNLDEAAALLEKMGGEARDPRAEGIGDGGGLFELLS